MKNKVIFVNRQRKQPVNKALIDLLRRSIKQTLLQENFPLPAEVSVTFVDDEKIQKINHEHRGIDCATDVLSFPLFEDAPNMDGRVMLGDIVISLERADAQAKEYGHSYERETAFLTVHSMLHLLGYDHETSEEDEKEMFARQEIVLSVMGLPRE